MAITSGSNASVVGASNTNNLRFHTEEYSNTGNKNSATTAKHTQNVAILQANEKVSLQSNNDSLSLLYKTALEGINAELEPILGPNAAQKIYDSGIDTSPQATADRIVSFSTAFYGRYKEQNPGLSEEETLDKFMSVIGGGIDKGFADAKSILQGLKVYEGEVESGVDQTYQYVLQGLTQFREKMLAITEQTQNKSADV